MVRRRLMMIALPLLAAPALSGCAGSGRGRPEPPMTAALRFAAALEAADPAVDAAVARMDGFERMAAREDSAIGFAVGGRAAPPSRFTAAPAGAAEAAGRVLSPAFTALSDYGHLLDQVAEGERIQGKPGPSGQQLAAAVGNGLAAVQAAGGTPVPEPVRTAGLAGIAALSDMPETMTRGGARPTLAGMVAAGQPHLQAVVALLRAVIGPEIGQGARGAIRARREALDAQQSRFLAALRADGRIGAGERYSIFRSVAELRDADPAEGTFAALIDLLAAIEQAHAALAADGPDAEDPVVALEAAVARVSVTTEGSRRG
ncbi:hypothetical protein QWZ14_26510 [Paeniroseomonas aquatica]|uniref:Uncharacterized protein n=1 Tax=Paeniroseomonas aquatica TaxID=373043 RepID=A0ABT8AE10_9PROT|nr:hypothetical protein [Paeniroseomonas aquatica]MDN3567948.1 hypothetical protein [Paeniroseomonas aquatica]